MKKLIIALLFGLAAPLAAQTPVMSSTLNLYNLGKPFGSSQQWQFGAYKQPVLGGCIQRELHDGQWLGGYCPSFLTLAKTFIDTDGTLSQFDIFHFGAEAMYNVERRNGSYGPRLGISLLPTAEAAIGKIVSEIPSLEGLLNVSLPPWVIYLNQVTTLDYGVEWRPIHDSSVKGQFAHGPIFALNIPTADIWKLLQAGL